MSLRAGGPRRTCFGGGFAHPRTHSRSLATVPDDLRLVLHLTNLNQLAHCTLLRVGCRSTASQAKRSRLFALIGRSGLFNFMLLLSLNFFWN